MAKRSNGPSDAVVAAGLTGGTGNGGWTGAAQKRSKIGWLWDHAPFGMAIYTLEGIVHGQSGCCKTLDCEPALPSASAAMICPAVLQLSRNYPHVNDLPAKHTPVKSSGMTE
jgi:hypothetical protein